MKRKFVKVRILDNDDGSALTHIAGRDCFGDYDTICGIDANDTSVGHMGCTVAGDRERLTCPACIAIWDECHHYRASRIALTSG